MTRSQLQWAVIPYTIIVTFNMILIHEIGRNAYDHVWEDPVLKNFTTTFNRIPINGTASYNGTSGNDTLTLNNTTIGAHLEENFEHFYRSVLPRNIFVGVLLFPLSYYWHIYLERFFPARPRSIEKNEKTEFNVNEGQEEEVVKRWIAQGKIKRASVSWWNTFVKWVLHLTVGKLWFYSLRHLVDGFVRWKTVKVILGNFKSDVLVSIFSSFLSISPLASLIGFIVIPATKRVVFGAAVSTIEGVFIESFFRVTVPWAVQNEFVQQILANATESIMKIQAKGGVNSTHFIDEL